MISSQPNCNDNNEPGLLSVQSALSKILLAIPERQLSQQINIEQARARTLAEAIIAPFNVPGYDNAAVDGYAISHQQITPGHPRLTIIDTLYAGQATAKPLQTNQCYRIMTGAAVPESIDQVVMQEQVCLKGDQIEWEGRMQSGQNIRRIGENIQQGETILPPGRLLTPADIGLIASLGITEIKVKQKLRVAIISTGNEIISPGQPYSPQHNFDSNQYILQAVLDRPDIEIIHLGILADDPAILRENFQYASQYADVIISSGGVSVGDADYTRMILEETGQINFWKIAIKPGRPLAFGQIGKTIFFGLPGNPVAVMVTFYQFVLPALEKMLGIKHKILAPLLTVKITEDIAKKPGRTEVLRGILEASKIEGWTIKTTGQQGSGILRSMSLANAFIILEHQRSEVKAGEMVTVQPFSGIM